MQDDRARNRRGYRDEERWGRAETGRAGWRGRERRRFAEDQGGYGYPGDRGWRDYGRGNLGRQGPYQSPGFYGQASDYERAGERLRRFDADFDRLGDYDRGYEQQGDPRWSRSGRWAAPEPASRRGGYAGRGPRGYRRSDERIHEDVCERLTRHGEIDADDIDVEVRDGEVTLRGSVDSRQTKRLAEDLVEDVAGVVDVHNQLRPVTANWREVSRAQTSTSTGAAGATMAGTMGANMAGTSGLTQPGTRANPLTGAAGAAMAGNAGAGVTNTAQRAMGSLTGETPHGPGMSPAGPGQPEVRATMEVVGADGQLAGRVDQVREQDFLLDRPVERDLYVPLSAVKVVSGDRVMLNVRADEVDDQGWVSTDVIRSVPESGGQA